MSTKAIFTRYAHALLNQAERLNAVPAIEQDVATIRRYVEQSADLRMLFRSPIIEYWRKKRIVTEIFQGSVHDLSLSFLHLVVEKRREKYLVQILDAFQDQLDIKRNLLRVGVTSAQPLEDELQAKMTSALSTRTGKTVLPTFTTNQDLIAGISVTIGDTVIDGSLRTRLAELREQLAHT